MSKTRCARSSSCRPSIASPFARATRGGGPDGAHQPARGGVRAGDRNRRMDRRECARRGARPRAARSGAISLASGRRVPGVSLFLVVLVLGSQRHEDEVNTRREMLSLELAVLSEQKTAKIIQMLEEFRRDHPQMLIASISRRTPWRGRPTRARFSTRSRKRRTEAPNRSPTRIGNSSFACLAALADRPRASDAFSARRRIAAPARARTAPAARRAGRSADACPSAPPDSCPPIV